MTLSESGSLHNNIEIRTVKTGRVILPRLYAAAFHCHAGGETADGAIIFFSALKNINKLAGYIANGAP